MPVVLTVVGLGLGGSGMVVAGAYVLGGLGIALLTAGVLMFGAAVLVRSGMTNV